jgi:thioredoxin-like negative regulator of GroEL
MKKFSLLAALLVMLSVGYFAVTKIGHQTATFVMQAARGQEHGASSQQVSVGSLSFKDTDGQTITVKPNDKTVLHFMTSSCSDCLPMEKTLTSFAHSAGVRLVSIDADPQSDTVSTLEAFKKAGGATWPYVMDQNQSLVQQFHITSLDTVVILYQGQVIYNSIAPSKSALEKVLS